MLPFSNNVLKKVAKLNIFGKIILDSQRKAISDPQMAEKLLVSSYTISREQLQSSTYELRGNILRTADVSWETQFP